MGSILNNMDFLISPTEPKKLKDMLDCIVDRSCEEQGADIVFFCPDGSCLVQRKTTSDFVASIRDGRLRHEVVQLQTSPHRYLLLEGRFRYSRRGFLLIKGKEVKWTKEQIEKLKLSIENKGIQILYSENLPETAAMLVWLAEWYQKQTHSSLEGRGTAVSNKWPFPVYRDQVKFFYQGIPGFSGGTLADRLVEQYPTPNQLFSASENDLKQMPGIGEVRAKAITGFLNGGQK